MNNKHVSLETPFTQQPITMPQNSDKKPWALFVQKAFHGGLFEGGIIGCIQVHLSFRANSKYKHMGLHLGVEGQLPQRFLHLRFGGLFQEFYNIIFPSALVIDKV